VIQCNVIIPVRKKPDGGYSRPSFAEHVVTYVAVPRVGEFLEFGDYDNIEITSVSWPIQHDGPNIETENLYASEYGMDVADLINDLLTEMGG
jgi:hypothetical protein